MKHSYAVNSTEKERKRMNERTNRRLLALEIILAHSTTQEQLRYRIDGTRITMRISTKRWLIDD